MPKRVNPATSNEAYRSLNPEKISEIQKRIIAALKVLGPSTYEDIAIHLGEKPQRIWKRMSECNRDGLAYRNGDRKIMSSGRQGFLWIAADPGQKDPFKKRQRVLKGPTVSDFSKAINQVKQSIKTRDELF